MLVYLLTLCVFSTFSSLNARKIPEGDVWSHQLSVGNKTYFINGRWTNATEAVNSCKNNGLQLATLENKEETDALIEDLKLFETRKTYWTAGKFDGKKWISSVTGKELSFTDWGTNQPSLDKFPDDLCVTFDVGKYPTGHWTSTECKWQRAIICQNVQ